MSYPRAAARAAAAVVVVTLLTACGTAHRAETGHGSPAHLSTSPSTVVSVSVQPTVSAATSAPPDAAHTALAAMSETQRIGQLFMVGTSATAPDAQVAALVASGQVGSIFLAGNSTVPAAQTRTLITSYTQAAGSTGLFVATDQEGGTVQRLKGPDFAPIPSALIQGRTPATERANAKLWGTQLASVGVNVNLAPVLDTVPSAAVADTNPPIGALDREFGYTPPVVSAAGTAFAEGLADAGIDSTIKHFPGLGRVTGNTDTQSGVTDSITGPDDPYLAPFAAAITAGAPFVMMSLATYAKLDPSVPAAFSSAIVTNLLRTQLRFTGVVISDDLGATRQVAAYAAGERATRFIAAGGDLALNVVADQIAPMAAAVLARTQSDPTFAAQVDAAALRVLEAKQARGLLH